MPLQHPSPPQPSDLRGVYEDLNLSAAQIAQKDLYRWCKAAYTWWEDQTRYKPFLAVTQTRNYDPPGFSSRYVNKTPVGQSRKLYFGAGVLSVTSITTQNGVLVQGTDFWLFPANAPAQNEPYLWAEFAAPQYGDRLSMVVNGSFGYCSDIPHDAWSAILSKAAELSVPELMNMIDKGMLGWTDGDTSETYGKDNLTNQRQAWADEASSTAIRYMRIL